MIQHDKYDKIQVDNIVQAAKDLIDILSTGNKPQETVIRGDFDRFTKSTKALTRAINVLKHQLRHDYE